ncbi:MAG: V-type ATP synthase subunit E, partial [Clostridia bacterium]|nr:V-type ATP synthase subunit E [Clostridia bacterium]
MAGLDKIIERITQDSAVKCEGILKEATAQATSLKADAAAVSKKDADKLLAKAAKHAQSIVEMAESGSAVEQKNALLDAKVGIIDEAVDYAKTKLTGAGDADYFDTVMKLVKAYA